jgi:predicted ester cyclase
MAIKVRGMQIGRFVDGKMVERRGSSDELGILKQIGPGAPEESGSRRLTVESRGGPWVAPGHVLRTSRGMQIGRFVDGKMVERRGSSDELGILKQIGAIEG